MAIYDAITEPSRWKSTLDAVASEIGAVGGGLYMRRDDAQPYDFLSWSSAYDRASLDEYMARHAALEAPQWEFLSRQPPLALVFDDRAGVPRETLDVRADYVFNREFVGVRRRVAFRMNDIPAWYDAAIFGFGLDHEDIPARSIRALRPFLPHLAKAIEVGRSFALLRERYQAALAALDKVQVGMAVALGSGEIVVHNAEAARIIDCADGLTLGRDGRLAVRDPVQQDAISGAIAVAARALRGERSPPATLTRISRRSGRHPLLVEITPLADSGGEIDVDLAGALVVLVDPDNIPIENVRRAAAIYGLTPTEARICEMLVEGIPGPEIAERRGTAVDTVKDQVAAIMLKTGARSRGGLIRTILRAMPPVG